MDTEDDLAAAGISVAQKALHAAADGNDDEILSIINSASHAEVAWAAAYLVSAVRETVTKLAKGNPRKTARILHAAASNVEDGLMVRLDLIIDQALRDSDN